MKRACFFSLAFSLLASSYVSSANVSELAEPDVTGPKPVRTTSDSEIFDNLLEVMKYDKRERPAEKVSVATSVYVYWFGHVSEENLQFEVSLQIRHRWKDPRLNFYNSNLTDAYTTPFIQGEEWFADRIWTPNIFIENELASDITSLTRRNYHVNIIKTGQVFISYRVFATVLSNYELGDFPHDTQMARIRLESWGLSTEELEMKWDDINPLQKNSFSPAEYEIIEFSKSQGVSCYQATYPVPKEALQEYLRNEESEEKDLIEGDRVDIEGDREDGEVIEENTACEGLTATKHSVLNINFVLKRNDGAYFIDYYIPSGLLVCMSWVSFWFAPDSLPARTTLGTSTWLTFITLTHNTGTGSLPRVSNIKFIDIWFFGCTIFIFGSLLEFAVVNTIHRSKRAPVEVKNTRAKNVLPAAVSILTSPAVSRRGSLTRSDSKMFQQRQKKYSTASLAAPNPAELLFASRSRRNSDEDENQNQGRMKKTSEPNLRDLENGKGVNNKATPPKRKFSQSNGASFKVHQKMKRESLPPQVTLMNAKNSVDDCGVFINPDPDYDGDNNNNNDCVAVSISVPDKEFMEKVGKRLENEDRRGSIPIGGFDFTEALNNWRSMSNAEIAIWIDVKARTVFPMLFAVFVIIYFFFAYGLQCQLFNAC